MTRLSSGFNASLPFHWFLETTKKSLFLSFRICCVTIEKKAEKEVGACFQADVVIVRARFGSQRLFSSITLLFFLAESGFGKKKFEK